MMNASMFVTALSLFAAGAAAACTGPSTQGGLTILTENHLDAAPNDGSAAILAQQASPYDAAKTACTQLGELLWNPDTQPFNATLRLALSYQRYQGFARESQLYWIAQSNSTAACRGLDGAGNVHNVDCKRELPALCTQTAPVSTTSTSDISERWRIKHTVGAAQLVGYRDLHVWKFRGLRFADTPARFTYAKMRSFDTPGEINATTAGADCSQPVGEVKNGSSEDCLFANVWTPFLPPKGGAAKAQLRPVMLYYYGGGFTSGSGKNTNTDGTNLASRGDVVVVSVNYRVGSIGFLAFDDGVHKGNYAISDMVAALEWVQKYIRDFGGDPNNVTIFGESAGAASVMMLLGVAKAQGLFQRAIMQSSPDGTVINGKFSFPQANPVAEEYNTTTQQVLQAAGCQNATDAIACLSKYSGFELVSLPVNAHGVVQDGTYVDFHEPIVNQTGRASKVDVIVGVNRDEVGVQVPVYPPDGVSFNDFFSAAISGPLGLSVDQALLDKLNVSSLTTPAQIFNATLQIATDGAFTCLNLAKAYSAAKHGAWKSAYFYEFNRTYGSGGYTQPWCDAPKTTDHPNGDPNLEYFKCHGAEQMAVFGTELRAGHPDRDGLDVPFMQLVIDYWTAFARKGDPNPDRSYLLARGRTSTLDQLNSVGKWEPVKADKPTLRVLQWNGVQIPFSEQTVCNALGIGMDSLEA